MSDASRVRRVVVGFDGSDSGRVALDRAIEESRARSVPLHVVTVVDDVVFYGVSDARIAAAEAVLTEAEQQGQAVLGSGRVTTRVLVGRPVTLLLDSCEPDDLLVVGSHGHRRLARMLLGSTSSSVVIHAPCPVLVCRGQTAGDSGPVLVGVDGSEASRLAIEFATDIAGSEGVMLRAVIAVPPLLDAFGVVTAPDEPALQSAQAVLAECLSGLRDDRPDVVVEPLVVRAHPVEALLQHAQDARLVVVGSRGRGALESVLLGSTARELTQQAPCPVLVARGTATE